ncbi:MAG TPA: AAC(3) family N-acetyltransferase [Anaerolineae bacterium]|nr:AAC(3) family N-acetyltransferase [Anaerolineae bacterium]
MSEEKTVAQTPTPRTRHSLGLDLRRLGLRPGMTVLVHASLSQIGWVSGGPVAVIHALQDVLTPQGTLVMPAHTLSGDPADWENPPVPKKWYETIRQHRPAFDPRLTPTRQMGAIAELFRTWPDVLRSNHPADSFSAWGQHAEFVTANHALNNGLGDNSPLGRLYDLDGWILLLGVGHINNTSFHLAEYRAPNPTPASNSTTILYNNHPTWITYHDIELDPDPFPQIGAELEETGVVTINEVGSATARLMSQPIAVDFATNWIHQHRQRTTAT